VDMLLYRRRTGYDERELYSPASRYGSVNLAGVLSFLIAAAVGLGLVTSTATIFKWTGYLIDPLFPGTKADIASVAGQVAGSSIRRPGVLHALPRPRVAGRRVDRLLPRVGVRDEARGHAAARSGRTLLLSYRRRPRGEADVREVGFGAEGAGRSGEDPGGVRCRHGLLRDRHRAGRRGRWDARPFGGGRLRGDQRRGARTGGRRDGRVPATG